MKRKFIRRAAALLLALGLPVQAADLMEIHRLALENDPQLRAADASRLAVGEAKPQSRAVLLPNLSLSAGVGAVQIDKPSAAVDPDYSTNNYTLSLSQAVFHYDYLVQLRQADARVAQAETEYQATLQDLSIRVAEAYFAVLAAQDEVEYRRKEKAAIARQLEQAKKRFEVGLIAITSVHEAQASYDLVVAEEIAAGDQLDSAREALAQITGEVPEELARLGSELDLASPEPADLEQWAATALEKNLQILAAGHGVEASREQIEVNRAGHYPTVDLTASHAYTDNNGGLTGGSTSENSSIGLTVSLPLFSGGATSSQVREAAHLYTQAREELEQQRRSVRRQARDAYRGVVAAISRVAALKQALVSTQSALEATEAGFEVGTRTIVDVLDSQRDVYRSLRDYDQARYDYLLNTLRLRQAAGSLSEADLVQVNHWLR